MMTMLQKISRPATEECCALCWHPECVLSRRKGREGWPWSLKEEDDDDDDGNDENYVALLLEEPLWPHVTPTLKNKFFFRQGNWCPIILRWWKWHQWSRLLFCYSSVLPQDVEAWYPISAKTRATTFGSWAVLLWLDRVFSMFSSQNETLHIFEIQFWELCSLSSTVIQKKHCSVSQFSKLESDQGQIWARLDVYSTRDAWHFPPGSRRSNYVKIYSALSLFSDLIGRQFANVFQLGRSTRTKHTDLKSTTNKYSYKC